MVIKVLQMRGLGNQMFQYVAGLYFANKYRARLQIVREPESQAASFGHPRPFLLSNFCITEPVRNLTLWDRAMCSVAVAKKPVIVPARWLSRTFIYRQPAHEDGEFLPMLPMPRYTRNVYLEGNFQSYKFSQALEERVRSEFRFSEPARGKNMETLEQIHGVSNPISLHVRRGDYTKNKGGQELLPIGYYAKSMEVLSRQIQDPTFFVFSDDIAFAREALPRTGRLVFVDHNDEANGHEDLRLMSSCRHHIIANSTLSWWGAWLNPHSDKLVCAPKVWRNPKIPYTDLIPSAWLRIPNDGSSD